MFKNINCSQSLHAALGSKFNLLILAYFVNGQNTVCYMKVKAQIFSQKFETERERVSPQQDFF